MNTGVIKGESKRASLWARTRALSLPPQLTLCFFGFAFSKAANDIASYRFSLYGGFDPLVNEDVFSIAMMLTFLVLAVAARRIAPLYPKRWAVFGAVFASILSALLALAATIFPTLLLPLMGLAMIAGGLSGASFILMWAEFHSCLDPLRIVLYVSGAFLLGTLGAWLLRDLDTLRSTMVLCVLPFISVLCLRASFARIDAVDLPKKVWGRYRFPWRLIVVLGIYEFVYGVREAAALFAWDMFTLGVITVSFCLFILAYFFSRRMDFSVVYQTPFLLMVGGLAMVPLTASLGEAASDFCVSAGYSLMFLALTFLLCDLSHRHGVSVLVLCGVQELTAGFRLAGHQVPTMMQNGTLPVSSDAALSVVLTGVVIVASLLLLAGRRFSVDWGASFFGVGKMVSDAEVSDKLLDRCAELERLHNLSPREREVFELLAQGKKPATIERELYIANGTLKSHTRRIYQKLGIHSKKELRQMLGKEVET